MALDKLLVIGAALFCCGLYTILTRRNAVAVLMGVELVLNAANINFVAFSHYVSRMIGGQIFAVFVIVLQEWWGLVDHIKDVAERFAAEGFVALAPDLYHGETTS